MLEDVQNTNTGFKEWADGVETLVKRGVDEGLIEQMNLAGPQAANEIKALNSMTDAELKIWVETSKDNASMFREKAVEEAAKLKGEVETQLQLVQDAIDAKEAGMIEVGKKLALGV